MSSSATRLRVRRRKVFYIPGYDPFHPRRYRELYRKEGRKQSELSGYELSVSAKSGDGPFGWKVMSKQDGEIVHSEVDVLVWSDIVRDSMSNSIAATYLQLVRTAWIYTSSGALWRLMQLRKGPVIAALYPVIMLLFQLAVAIIIFWLVFNSLAPIIKWFAVPAAALAGYVVLSWFRRLDRKLFAYYLMHDYAYSARLWGVYAPELERRLENFVALVEKALRDDVDEVLVVGHSSGAHLGVSVLADVIRQGVPENGPKLSFLSLGQVVPMVSFLPKAHRLRSDLKCLCASTDLTWIDVSAPGDGCAFALCDPVAVSGVSASDKKWPLILSAAFTQTLSVERWKALRRRFFRLHFQYLCAFDQPGDYDYFRLTAGPLTLAERFRDRAPSRSRIETTVSKFTSVSA